MNKLTVLLFGIVLPFLVAFKFVSFQNRKTIAHQIEVLHPGNEFDEKEKIILFEVQDNQNKPVEYYADVKSVICLENVCKVVEVRIFWNPIGEYIKYELEEGVILEKYEADVFITADYKKLHHVLSSKNSPYKNVKVNEILTIVDENNAADAVSGATALVLKEEETVPGAALTCFTLWHWANGEITSVIRKISGNSCSEKMFISYLIDDNTEFNIFALEQLIEQKMFTKRIVNFVVKKSIENNKELLKLAIQYFEQAPEKIYFSSMKRIFVNGLKSQKIGVLNSLKNTKLIPPKKYFDSFSNQIPSLKSYQEISLFLDLMEIKNLNSKEIISKLMPLLDGEFLIARRVYWFLIQQELTKEQQLKMDTFYTNKKEQL